MKGGQHLRKNAVQLRRICPAEMSIPGGIEDRFALLGKGSSGIDLLHLSDDAFELCQARIDGCRDGEIDAGGREELQRVVLVA